MTAKKEAPELVRPTDRHTVTLVLIPLAAQYTGYSVGAIEQKIALGIWREGMEWRRAPDGRSFIDLQAVMRWVEGQ